MSCERIDRTLEALTGSDVGCEAQTSARRHAESCAECRALAAAIGLLHEASGAFAVPERSAEHWVQFQEQLASRLASQRENDSGADDRLLARELRTGRRSAPLTWTTRPAAVTTLGLALAAAAMAAGFLFLARFEGVSPGTQPGGARGGSRASVDDATAATGSTMARGGAALSQASGAATIDEQSLVARLAIVPRAEFDEAALSLGSAAATDPFDDTASDEVSYDPETAPFPGAESSYDLFFDLDGNTRSRVLKEFRSDLG